MNKRTEKLISGVILGTRSRPVPPPPDAALFVLDYIRQQKTKQPLGDHRKKMCKNFFSEK
jgi:hypothetical protein